MEKIISKIRDDLSEVEEAVGGGRLNIPRDYGMLYLASIVGWEWPDYASRIVTAEDFNKAIVILKGAINEKEE